MLGVLGFYSREPAPRAAHLAAHYLAQLPTALLWALVSTVVLPACPVRKRSAGHGVAVSAVMKLSWPLGFFRIVRMRDVLLNLPPLLFWERRVAHVTSFPPATR